MHMMTRQCLKNLHIGLFAYTDDANRNIKICTPPKKKKNGVFNISSGPQCVTLQKLFHIQA